MTTNFSAAFLGSPEELQPLPVVYGEDVGFDLPEDDAMLLAMTRQSAVGCCPMSRLNFLLLLGRDTTHEDVDIDRIREVTAQLTALDGPGEKLGEDKEISLCPTSIHSFVSSNRPAPARGAPAGGLAGRGRGRRHECAPALLILHLPR